MKKILALVLSVMLLVAAGVSLAEDTVTIFSWDGYIDDEVLGAFEQETGIKVIWSSMDSVENMLLKMSQGNTEDYDLILSSDYSLDIMRKAGMIQKIDKSLLSNYGNLDERFLNQKYDPDNEYVIPYVAGCPLIVYDPAQVGFEIKGYKDLWNPELKDSVAVLGSVRVLLGIALKSMGKSMNETDPAVLAEMKEKLMPLYENIHVYGDTESYTAVATGESPVGFLFTPFVYLAQMEMPELVAVYPEEGLGYGIDGFVIPTGAKNAKNAHILLDYLMRPEVAAHNAEYQCYMCVNKAAEACLSDEFKNSKVMNVPTELLTTAEFIEDVGETETLYQEIFTAFMNQ